MDIPSSIIAIIPARGGSKRIPGKNLVSINGRSLLSYSIVDALKSSHIQETYVSTDDTGISVEAEKHGASVILRPQELSSDTATSESALLHVLDERKKQGQADPELIVFLQATTPFREEDDIDKAIEQLVREGADSLVTACKDLGLFWSKGESGVSPVNYEIDNRKRSQEWEELFRENGSFFIFKTELLRKTNNRLGGKISLYEMGEAAAYEIDTQEDLERIRNYARRLMPQSPNAVEYVVFDFDGVMTDNSVDVYEGKREMVRCNRGDGWGIDQMRKANIPMMVLSTEKNIIVAERCAKLQIPCHHGVGNKGEILQNFLQENHINPMNVVYVGNDDNDRECLKLVGHPIVVADAHPSVLSLAKWITTRKGGQGAVREVCDWILKE